MVSHLPFIMPSIMKGLFWCLEKGCVDKKGRKIKCWMRLRESECPSLVVWAVEKVVEQRLPSWQSRWGFSWEGRTGSRKLYCSSRVCWWKRKQSYSEPLGVFWLLDKRAWEMKTSSIPHLKSELLGLNVSVAHYQS